MKPYLEMTAEELNRELEELKKSIKRFRPWICS